MIPVLFSSENAIKMAAANRRKIEENLSMFELHLLEIQESMPNLQLL